MKRSPSHFGSFLPRFSRTARTCLLGSAAILNAFAGWGLAAPIDVTTLTKNASGQYAYTFTTTGNDKVDTTSFTYGGAEDVTLYLDASTSNWTDGRWRYQGSITETGTGKLNVIWKTGALRMGAPTVTTDYTGSTTMSGAALYLCDGSEFGSGTLTIQSGANVCTGWNNSSPSNLVFNQPIVLQSGTVTFRAGWGSTAFNPPSTITFNGAISGNAVLQFGGEASPGPVTINSSNTYTNGTRIAYNANDNQAHTYYSGTDYALKCALFTLNSAQPFSTGAVTIASGGDSTNGTLPIMFAFKTTDGSGKAVNRTLTNTLALNGYKYKDVQYDSDLYLLNDGAVTSPASFGTVTVNSTLTGTGTLHIMNEGITVNLTNAKVDDKFISTTANIVGTSSSAKRAVVNYTTTADHQFTGALTGNMDLTIKGNSNVRFNHNYGAGSSFTGNTYLNCVNVYLTNTDELGAAADGTAIYVNITGNLSNGGNYGISRPVINKDIVLQRNLQTRIGWSDKDGVTVDNPCSITFNGDISGAYSLALGCAGNEQGSGRYVLNGNNTYSGGTILGSFNNASSNSVNVYRTEYVLGTNSAFGSKKDGLSFFKGNADCTPVSIKLNTTDSAHPVTFEYALNITDHVVTLGNFGANTVVFNSAITGNAGSTIYFGEMDYTQYYTYRAAKTPGYDWANKQNAGKGLIQFDGTIGTAAVPMNAVVNEKVLFGGTGTINGTLTISPDATLSLGSANVGNPMEVSDLVLDGDIVIDLDSLKFDGELLRVTGTSDVDAGSEIVINYGGSVTGGESVSLIDFGSGVDFGDLSITLNTAGGGMLWLNGEKLMLSSTNAVPEPSTLALALTALLLGLGVFRRRAV